jgi:hypothetical protein
MIPAHERSTVDVLATHMRHAIRLSHLSGLQAPVRMRAKRLRAFASVSDRRVLPSVRS